MKSTLFQSQSTSLLWLFLAAGKLFCVASSPFVPQEDSLRGISGNKVPNAPISAESTAPRRIRQRFIVFDTEQNDHEVPDDSSAKARAETDTNLSHADSSHAKRSKRNRNTNVNTPQHENKDVNNKLEFGQYRALKTTMAKTVEMQKREEKRNERRAGNSGLDNELDTEVLEYVLRSDGLENSIPLPPSTNKPSASAPKTPSPTVAYPEIETIIPTYEPTSSASVPIIPAPTSKDSEVNQLTNAPSFSSINAETSKPTAPPQKGGGDTTSIPTYSPTSSSTSYFPTTSGTYTPTTFSYFPTYGTFAPTSSTSNNDSKIDEDTNNDDIPASTTGLSCPLKWSKNETIREDLRLYYDVVLEKNKVGIICVRLESDDEGWLGFGFSLDGGMVGSTAVIGLPDYADSIANPGKYSLDGKTESLVAIMRERSRLWWMRV